MRLSKRLCNIIFKNLKTPKEINILRHKFGFSFFFLLWEFKKVLNYLKFKPFKEMTNPS